MTVRFTVHPEVFAAFPGMRIVAAVAEGLDNRTHRPAIEREWRAAWEGAAAAKVHGNAQSHPRVRPWRERFRALGVSGKKYPSSIEALLRRALKGGEPFSINPLVDFYNAVSLRHVVPAGAYDLDEVGEAFELRPTRDGDSFEALDADAAEPLPAGEIAYVTGGDVLTRHLIWRQSRRALVTGETRRALLLSEVLGELEAALADRVAADFEGGLERHFGCRSRLLRLDAAAPAVDL